MDSHTYLHKISRFVKECNSSNIPCKVDLIRIDDGNTFHVSLNTCDHIISDLRTAKVRNISFDSFFKIFERVFPDVKEEISFCITYRSLKHRYSIEFTISDDLLPF